MITLKGIDPRMIANNLEPSEPIHPGELLKEELDSRGISQKKLAERMGMSYTVLNEVLNCKRAVTAEYALLFEAALGIEAGMWIRIQADYNMQKAKQNKSFSDRLAEIRKITAAL
ncbi:MAG: HigA family addiction module antidote protein [Tannerellaceae bacterium]|jgi:addiction module HigA family antidote|nr:HigA family addiction module antidote protein [Tannerellaceae bacterium]